MSLESCVSTIVGQTNIVGRKESSSDKKYLIDHIQFIDEEKNRIRFLRLLVWSRRKSWRLKSLILKRGFLPLSVKMRSWRNTSSKLYFKELRTKMTRWFWITWNWKGFIKRIFYDENRISKLSIEVHCLCQVCSEYEAKVKHVGV